MLGLLSTHSLLPVNRGPNQPASTFLHVRPSLHSLNLDLKPQFIDPTITLNKSKIPRLQLKPTPVVPRPISDIIGYSFLFFCLKGTDIWPKSIHNSFTTIYSTAVLTLGLPLGVLHICYRSGQRYCVLWGTVHVTVSICFPLLYVKYPGAENVHSFHMHLCQIWW